MSSPRYRRAINDSVIVKPLENNPMTEKACPIFEQRIRVFVERPNTMRIHVGACKDVGFLNIQDASDSGDFRSRSGCVTGVGCRVKEDKAKVP